MELLTESKLDIKLGLVQTAYANGSSTKYINETLVRILSPFCTPLFGKIADCLYHCDKFCFQFCSDLKFH